MVIPSAVAYGVLVSVGVVVLVLFLVVFMRLERAPKRIEEDRPPTPVGWPISTADTAPSVASVVSPAGRRHEMSAPQYQKKPS